MNSIGMEQFIDARLPGIIIISRSPGIVGLGRTLQCSADTTSSLLMAAVQKWEELASE